MICLHRGQMVQKRASKPYRPQPIRGVRPVSLFLIEAELAAWVRESTKGALIDAILVETEPVEHLQLRRRPYPARHGHDLRKWNQGRGEARHIELRLFPCIG
jgi:hypothetical protein